MTAERREVFRIQMQAKNLDQSTVDKIADLFPGALIEGMTMNYVYDMNITYYDCIAQLTLIERLCDTGKFSFIINTKQIICDARCLIQDILHKIEQIEKKYPETRRRK